MYRPWPGLGFGLQCLGCEYGGFRIFRPFFGRPIESALYIIPLWLHMSKLKYSMYAYIW